MKYLVMECRPSYAVVLDEGGQFQKVPNLGYQVGQTLDQVVRFEEQRKKPRLLRWVATAACLCLMLLGMWQFWQAPSGIIRIKINPDVQMEVNRFDRVVSLVGLNADGEALIQGYRAYGRRVEQVSDDLADRAMSMGYLQKGGKISLIVSSDRKDWKIATEEKLLVELDIHLTDDTIVISLTPEEKLKEENPWSDWEDDDDDDDDDDDWDDREDEDDKTPWEDEDDWNEDEDEDDWDEDEDEDDDEDDDWDDEDDDDPWDD